MMNEPALQSAIEWYISLNDPAVTTAEQAAFEQWLSQSEQHREAWQSLQGIQQPFSGLDARLTQQVFFQKEALRNARRASMKKIASLLILGAGSGMLYQQQPWRPLLADMTTGKGERREMRLPDETVLVLNSHSAVNIMMDGRQRRIELLQGQIMVTSGHPAHAAAKLQVLTRLGLMTAMGTRFAVEDAAKTVTLDVYSHAVKVESNATSAAPLVIQQGQRLRLQAGMPAERQQLPAGSDLWVQGILSVIDMPLAEFLLQLERYHSGFIRCDISIAKMPVSGAFPIAQRDQIISSLQQTYHLQAVQYMRFWTQLKPAT